MTVQITPLPQTLTANEKRVKELLDSGKTVFQIAYKLHMGFETVREIIFDIRKKESIMKKRITDEQRELILELHRQGMKQLAISAEVDVSQSAVCNIIKAATAPAELPEENAPMLEDAITKTEEQQIAEMPGLPRCVWSALDDRITALNLDIQLREQHIEDLKSDIDRLVIEREQIRAWMEAHE